MKCPICSEEPHDDFADIHRAFLHKDRAVARSIGYKKGDPVWGVFEGLQISARRRRGGRIEWSVRPPSGVPMWMWDGDARRGYYRFGVLLGLPESQIDAAPRGLDRTTVFKDWDERDDTDASDAAAE